MIDEMFERRGSLGIPDLPDIELKGDLRVLDDDRPARFGKINRSKKVRRMYAKHSQGNFKRRMPSDYRRETW